VKDQEVEQKAWQQNMVSLSTMRDWDDSRKFIAFSGSPHCTANVTEFARSYFFAAWKLLLLGALSGRLAVFPPVNCSSPWISHNKYSRSGIDQVRCSCLGIPASQTAWAVAVSVIVMWYVVWWTVGSLMTVEAFKLRGSQTIVEAFKFS
jgi:hypothetical protein